jgi:hypothetical protein
VDQLQLGGVDELRERVRIGLEDEDVPLEQRPVSGRDVAPVALSDDRGNSDVAVAKRFELADGFADVRRSRRQADLRDVVLDREAGLRRGAGAPLDRRQQPPAEGVVDTIIRRS